MQVFLRGGTQSIQKQVDERKSGGGDPIIGSRQFLSDARIIAAATSPTDVKALEDPSAAIRAAVLPLRDATWLREPDSELDRWGFPAGGMYVQHLGDTTDSDKDKDAAGAALDEMLNSNVRVGQLVTPKHDGVCPPALHHVGLGGLFLLAKMGDNN
ncbi:hypothetical protein V8D89_009798 [Ganoderma adspersum]